MHPAGGNDVKGLLKHLVLPSVFIKHHNTSAINTSNGRPHHSAQLPCCSWPGEFNKNIAPLRYAMIKHEGREGLKMCWLNLHEVKRRFTFKTIFSGETVFYEGSQGCKIGPSIQKVWTTHSSTLHFTNNPHPLFLAKEKVNSWMKYSRLWLQLDSDRSPGPRLLGNWSRIFHTEALLWYMYECIFINLSFISLKLCYSESLETKTCGQKI